ncbi:MAG: hypothetical protein V8R55_11860, partial [Dysosmobacter sp.]
GRRHPRRQQQKAAGRSGAGRCADAGIQDRRRRGRLAKINSVDDARFSLKAWDRESKSVAALQEENRLLREQMKDDIAIQRRNGSSRRAGTTGGRDPGGTQRVTTDKKAVTAAAKQLIQNYGADIAVKDIQETSRASMTTSPAATTARTS